MGEQVLSRLKMGRIMKISVIVFQNYPKKSKNRIIQLIFTLKTE